MSYGTIIYDESLHKLLQPNNLTDTIMIINQHLLKSPLRCRKAVYLKIFKLIKSSDFCFEQVLDIK